MTEEQHAGVIGLGRSAIDALRASPILLLLLLLQILMFGALLYSSVHRQEAVSEQFNNVYRLLEACMGRRQG